MLRPRKGDQSDLSFHKEHDSKVAVLPCFPDEPICADDKGNNGESFCFLYATFFKKVKLRLPFTRFERELLTELNIAPPASSQLLGVCEGVPNHVCPLGAASFS